MLIERGAIATAGTKWTLHTARLLQTEIPTTLIGVLQARLDSLPRNERQALQGASVVGHVFWDQTLAALDAQAPAALPALGRRELVLLHDDDAAPDDVREFAFSHKILHDVTYDTVLKRRRRDLHARAADWLASRSAARASEWLAAAAEHYALAGNVAQAAEYFARAAEHARSRHAHETALAHTARALALLDGADPAIAAARSPRAALAAAGRARVHLRPARPARRAAPGAGRDAAASPRRSTTTGRAHWRRGGAASSACAPATTRCRRLRRARRWFSRRAPGPTSRAWRRSACWPTRSAHRAASRRARRSPGPAWPRRARSACGASRASS